MWINLKLDWVGFRGRFGPPICWPAIWGGHNILVNLKAGSRYYGRPYYGGPPGTVSRCQVKPVLKRRVPIFLAGIADGRPPHGGQFYGGHGAGRPQMPVTRLVRMRPVAPPAAALRRLGQQRLLPLLSLERVPVQTGYLAPQSG